MSNGPIRDLLPPPVVTVDLFGDALDAEAWLFPEEEAALARAVDKPRREFTSVRSCARRALAGLGLGPAPLVPGERGAPSWPPGIVGSMRHCGGYRAAAVAHAGQLAALGIDFADAHVTSQTSGTFTARLLVPGPVLGRRRLERFTGRWLVRDGIAATAVAVERDEPA